MENENQTLNQKKSTRKNKFARATGGGNIFLILFAALFVAMIARSFTGPVGAPGLLANGQPVAHQLN